MSTFDEILWWLKDGKWHRLEEIKRRSTLSSPSVEVAVTFLREYSFIQLDQNNRKVKLRPSILKLIREIRKLEDRNLLCHESPEVPIGVEELNSLGSGFKRF